MANGAQSLTPEFWSSTPRHPLSIISLVLDEPLLDVEHAAALLNVRSSWKRNAARAGQAAVHSRRA